MWGYIIIGFVLMWVLQIVLSAFQLKHYNKTIREMSQGKSGYLGVGVDKRRFGVGSVVIIVCDKDGYVTESKTLEGVTVFQRFKENKTILNEHIDGLLNDDHEHFSVATKMAVDKIYSQMVV
ncbi:transcriptional regulator GutM [Pseudogracilibacillus sp. SE30717A]|uniref:transcriptional regulator GutM n=1 Tax=Pseudogracilibacillus sp. SE30717A TaxID=3098293 RepID=UPI00300DD24D